MPLLKATGFVLKTRSWGEGDKLATFFTREKGKIFGVVRGARKPKSHWGGALEPMTLLDLMVYEKGGRHTLTQCQIVKSFRTLRQPGISGSTALFLTELVDKLTTEEDPNPEAFNQLELALSALESGFPPLSVSLSFTLKFLNLLGFWPLMDVCASCGKRIEGGMFTFNPKSGGLICPDCQGLLSGNVSLGERTINRIKILLHSTYPELRDQAEDLELNELLLSFLRSQLGMETSKVKTFLEKLEKEQNWGNFPNSLR
ncbi:MAG: DNA repair protein RecO [Caldiserica bacterium]|jgi:DNA repair protein RecO (recombination protein O)|nr:DNA repair protein RecO [Caldisericota bacterium]MDH7561923.1 DNA repair protein RecO [Caldisericota bacterium]